MQIVSRCLIILLFIRFNSSLTSEVDDGAGQNTESPLVNQNIFNSYSSNSTTISPLAPIFKGECDSSNCYNSTVNYSERDLRPCECDKDCIEFRDCCSDSEYYNQEEQQKSMDYECHQIGNFGFFLKRACPSSWDDVEISNKCIMSIKHDLDTEEIDLRSPVTSSATNITYGNIYCALCNNELDDVILWNVSVGNCVPKLKMNTRSNNSDVHLSETIVTSLEMLNDTDIYLQKKPIELSFGSLTFDGKSWFYEDERTRYNCHLILEPPSSLQMRYCSKGFVPAIHECPANWTDSRIAEQCRSIHSRVYSWHGTAYRNKYCAYCNGLNDFNLTCDSIKLYSAPGSVTRFFSMRRKQQFSILFDFKLKTDSKICNETKKSYEKIQKKLCPQNLGSYENKFAKQDSWVFFALSAYTFIAVLISLIFLVLHLMIFFAVRELQTIGGKNLASFCVALILAYGSFLFGNFVEDKVCYVIAVVMYYSFLCAFFWMLIISYDMWNTFWNATKKFRNPKNVRKTFITYSILVWSVPLILVGTTLYLDLAASKSVLAPHFGYNGCWFDNGFSLLLFFVGPVCTILITNFVLFLHTSYLLHSSSCESVNQKSRVDFKLFTRIGLLTGFTWITGFVAGYTQILIIWFIFIILNTAQGVFIFIAFSCKKRVIRSFLKRINKFEKWQRNLDETNPMSSCSTSTPLNHNVTITS